MYITIPRHKFCRILWQYSCKILSKVSIDQNSCFSNHTFFRPIIQIVSYWTFKTRREICKFYISCRCKISGVQTSHPKLYQIIIYLTFVAEQMHQLPQKNFSKIWMAPKRDAFIYLPYDALRKKVRVFEKKCQKHWFQTHLETQGRIFFAFSGGCWHRLVDSYLYLKLREIFYLSESCLFTNNVPNRELRLVTPSGLTVTQLLSSRLQHQFSSGVRLLQKIAVKVLHSLMIFHGRVFRKKLFLPEKWRKFCEIFKICPWDHGEHTQISNNLRRRTAQNYTWKHENSFPILGQKLMRITQKSTESKFAKNSKNTYNDPKFLP